MFWLIWCISSVAPDRKEGGRAPILSGPNWLISREESLGGEQGAPTEGVRHHHSVPGKRGSISSVRSESYQAWILKGRRQPLKCVDNYTLPMAAVFELKEFLASCTICRTLRQQLFQQLPKAKLQELLECKWPGWTVGGRRDGCVWCGQVFKLWEPTEMCFT